MELYQPITENMKLDMRMNLKNKKARPLLQLFSRQAAAVVDGWRLLCRWRSKRRRKIQTPARYKKLQTLCTHSFWVRILSCLASVQHLQHRN